MNDQDRLEQPEPNIALHPDVAHAAVVIAKEALDEATDCLRHAEHERDILVRELGKRQANVDALQGQKVRIAEHLRDLLAARPA